LFSVYEQHPLYRKGYDLNPSLLENKTIPRHKHYTHDIALVELAETVNLQTPYVKPICLPKAKQNSNFEDNNAINKRKEEEEKEKERVLEEEEEEELLEEYYGRFKRSTNDVNNNYVDMTEVERYGECWVTGWGDTKSKYKSQN